MKRENSDVKQRYWDWKVGGSVLGLVLLLAVFLVKPIGVSTQYVIFDGIVWNQLSPELIKEDSNAKSGYSSSNAYLNKSGGKYAKNVANPLNYGFVFMLSMFLGGFIAKRVSAAAEKKQPKEKVYKQIPTMRYYMLVFIGGIITLIGARMAGGCTSGHMVSGVMQTSVSGFLFVFAAFSTAVPISWFLYKKWELKS